MILRQHACAIFHGKSHDISKGNWAKLIWELFRAKCFMGLTLAVLRLKENGVLMQFLFWCSVWDIFERKLATVGYNYYGIIVNALACFISAAKFASSFLKQYLWEGGYDKSEVVVTSQMSNTLMKLDASDQKSASVLYDIIGSSTLMLSSEKLALITPSSIIIEKVWNFFSLLPAAGFSHATSTFRKADWGHFESC